ncbi:dipicolinate synthase subunit DpsA [Paratissierella segnis]|jgi:dipicolinate synthase subunit A|uniref:Dipicolinate synthase subunit DpsA n=1 Tax=Paratissierella segnis TaxID=2763679 RepID=A0A926ESY8_9FIRM|nr:dipicolinate synthase subunit DpsA [Paratissierella segnis]MBC8589203.1 dipicolinate synthase subunit DpsA [Paratissierella segnis]
MGRKFAILGGDMRSAVLSDLLKADGNEVMLFGFDKLGQYREEDRSLEDVIADAQFVIGPLPFSDTNEKIDTPFYTGEILVEDVLELLNKSQLFMGGKINDNIIDKAIDKKIKMADYFAREEMQVLNAIPTAEGAIQIAMEEMRITLHGSNAMVLGYGRIGKALSKALYGIGANVYAAARNYGDLAWIRNNNYTSVNISTLQSDISKMDVIFNTIPQMILNGELLNYIDKNCVIIDLASKPGGVDKSSAEKLKLNTISASGLPGKVAPITAAKVIKDTIYNIIEELEV